MEDLNETARRREHLHSPASNDAYVIVLERLADTRGVDLPEAAVAMDRAEQELPGSWEERWQDRLERAAPEVGFQARGVWLSLAETAGALRPGQPMVAFRRSESNPHGWTLLLDRRGGRVFRADLGGRGRGSWVEIEQLARELDVGDGDRMPWLLCDPILSGNGADSTHGHGSSATPFRRLVQLVRPDRGDLGSIVAFGVVVGGLSLATPLAVQQLVNSVALGGLLQPVVVLALLLMAVLAFSAILSAVQAFVSEIVQRRVFVRVAGSLSHSLPRVRLDAFDRQHGPELVNRFFDVITIQKVGSILLLDAVALVLQTLIGLLVLSFYHPLMLAFSVALLAGIAFVAFVLGRGAVSTAVAESRSKYAVQGWLEEMARCASDLKTRGAAQFAAGRADGLARQYLRARATHYRIVFRQLVGALGLQVLASSALLGLGGGLVIAGQLTLGQLVASELIVTAIVASFAKLGKHLESFYDLLASADKLGTLFDLPLERADGAALAPSNRGAAVALHGVSFRFEDSDVLHDVSFSVEPGERVALVGRGGAGKSTVLDILLGFRAPTAGYVTIDGADLRELQLAAVREQVARVRGSEIVEATIEENVRMGREHVSRKEVLAALEAVGLLDEVRALSDGLRTRLNSEGRPLSQGAAVRLTLARAIAGSPRLILLDDPLADLDCASRRRVLDALFAPEAPWTVLVTSAGGELSPWCDRVIRLSPDLEEVGGAPSDEGASREMVSP